MLNVKKKILKREKSIFQLSIARNIFIQTMPFKLIANIVKQNV